MSTSTRRSTGRARPPWKAVAAGSLAAFAVILGAEGLRLHQGHDPALNATSSSQSTAVASTQSSPSASSTPAATDDGGSFDSSSLPTTRSS